MRGKNFRCLSEACLRMNSHWSHEKTFWDDHEKLRDWEKIISDEEKHWNFYFNQAIPLPFWAVWLGSSSFSAKILERISICKLIFSWKGSFKSWTQPTPEDSCYVWQMGILPNSYSTSVFHSSNVIWRFWTEEEGRAPYNWEFCRSTHFCVDRP